MLRRIPVSLRFDDEENSDFYFGFIEQKKNDRELSQLILDLLHVYYENEMVRGAVDDYVVNKSPYMHIHAELERIALEHSRQRVTTNMLGDFTNNEQKIIEESPQTSNGKQEENNSSDKQTLLQLTEQVAALTKVVAGLTGGNTPNIVSPITEVSGKEEVKVETEVSTEVSKVVEVSKSVEIPKVIETPLDIELPINTEVKETSENNTVQDAPKVATSEEGIAVKKPASFGKLLKSVK